VRQPVAFKPSLPQLSSILSFPPQSRHLPKKTFQFHHCRFQTKPLGWAAVAEPKKKSKTMSLLETAGTMVDSSKSGRKYLPPSRIDILRLIDANVSEPSKDTISTVKFHSSGDVLMVGGADKTLRFFKVDGDKNAKQLSVRFNDMGISAASFLGASAQCVVSGRRPYFYSYDAQSGAVSKVTTLSTKSLKSHEGMVTSPMGDRIAFLGSGAGYVHIVCGKQKLWQMDIKMNTGARSAVFLDENRLFTSGVDADIYLWDLRKAGKCLHRFQHEDGTASTFLSACPNPASLSLSTPTPSAHFLSVGTESGVVSVFDHDALNMPAPMQPLPCLKTIFNLTTRITYSAFHPSGQLLAIASDEKIDQLRLIHMPSCTTYSNWPTERTPMRRVQCIDFSPGGGYMVVGNNKGKVLLYKLNHFSSA